MSDGVDLAVSRALDVLPDLFRLMSQAASQADTEPLTLTQLRILALVSVSPQLTTGLAAALGLTATTVSAAASSLVRRGLVRRLKDTADRRTVPLVATATGREAVIRARQRQEHALRCLITGLSEEEAAALAIGLGALGEALRGQCRSRNTANLQQHHLKEA